MIDALGFIETSGTVAAVDALDIMCKAADVHLVTWERKLGGRLVTLVVTGNVSAVTAAVESAKTRSIREPVCSNVIPRPHQELIRVLQQSINYQDPDAPALAAKAARPNAGTKRPAAKRPRKQTNEENK